MSSNLICLATELSKRKRGQELTPKQRVSMELQSNLARLWKLKRIRNYHLEKCKKAVKAYDELADIIKNQNDKLCEY